MCALGSMQIGRGAETNEGFVPVACVAGLCLDKQPAIYRVHQCLRAFQNVPAPGTTEIQCGGGGTAKILLCFFFFFPYPCGAGLAGLLCGRDFSLLMVKVMGKSARLPLIHY